MTLSIQLLSGNGQLPIHVQLVNSIRHGIGSGRLHSGYRLPSIRELAQKFSISPNTVARAYRELELEGLTENIAGKGTFVADLRATDQGITSDKASDILRQPIETLTAMGLSSSEILEAVDRLLCKSPMVLGIVGTTPRGTKKWADFLAHELRDYDVIFVEVSLDEFAAMKERALQTLKGASFVFSLLTIYATVRGYLAGSGLRVVPLIAEVSLKTHLALSGLPQGGKIGLVSEGLYANSMLGLVGNYCSVANVTCVAPHDHAAVESLLTSSDVVIYTFGSGEVVQKFTDHNCELISLDYQLSREKVQHIKELIGNAAIKPQAVDASNKEAGA